MYLCLFFFFSSRRRHTRYWRDWSSDVCSSDLRHEAEWFDHAAARRDALQCARIEHRHGVRSQIRRIETRSVLILGKRTRLRAEIALSRQPRVEKAPDLESAMLLPAAIADVDRGHGVAIRQCRV